MAKPVRQYGSTTQAPTVKDNPKPDAQAVADLHTNDDLDATATAHHHTLGPSSSQASPGNHTHDGGTSPKLLTGVTITGSRGGNSSLPSIIGALVALGATDNSTP
jgi:hypothetical protein